MRPRGSLGVAAFRSVWLSGLVSDAGDWLLFIALPLVVLERSGSAFGTSIAFLLELLPGILLTPVAARCAERLDPRRLLTGTAVVQGLALLPLVIVASATRSTALAVVYGVIIVESALTAVSDPTRNAVLPRLVPPAGLVSANSLVGLAQNVARLIGGPLGGLVFAAGGLRTVALCDLASYLVAAVLIVQVTVPGVPAEPTAIGCDGPIVVSTRSVLRLPAARRLLGTTFGCQIAQGMFVVLFVLFVVRDLHGDAADVGLLRGVQAVGAIVGALALVALARRMSPAALITGAILAFGTISLLAWNGPSVTTPFWPYVVAFALAGAPGVVLRTGLTSGLQLGVPAALHGRSFALATLASNAGQGIGILAAGVLTTTVGLEAMLDVQAAVYLGVGLMCLRLAPRHDPAADAIGPADGARRDPVHEVAPDEPAAIDST